MNEITLVFQERMLLKKRAAQRLRSQGKIPAVVYGQEKATHISVDLREFSKTFSIVGKNTVIRLQNGQTSYNVLVKDFQDNLLTSRINHVDFYHVSDTKPVRANILLHFQGTPLGIRNGGLLEHNLYEVEVECLAKDLTPFIEVDVAHLDIGQVIYVSNLIIPLGMKILTPSQAIVAHVISTKNLSTDTPEVGTSTSQEKKN